MTQIDCLIRNVSWEDRSCDLLVGQGRVLELSEAGTVPAPAGTEVVDAGGLGCGLPSKIGYLLQAERLGVALLAVVGRKERAHPGAGAGGHDHVELVHQRLGHPHQLQLDAIGGQLGEGK